MTNHNRLNQILDNATRAIQAAPSDGIGRLTILDCAHMLDLLPSITILSDARAELAKRLDRQLDPVWIAEGDLFELFSVLTALWKYDPTRVTGKSLAYAIQRLVSCEVAPGGPYRSNNKISIAANLQISSFARLVAKPLPGIDTFFDRITQADLSVNTELTSPYLLYLYATIYKNPTAANFIAKNRAKKTSLRAIGLSVLESTVASKRYNIAMIGKAQLPTGFWSDDDNTPQLVTTALIINLLALNAQKDLSAATSALLRQHQAVIETTSELFRMHSPLLRLPILAAIDAISQSNRSYDITLPAYTFASMLKGSSSLTKRQYNLLGAASVCGWIAYTIYDDFLDNEGKLAQLPVANAAMRTSIDCFKSALPKHRVFWRYTTDAFINMDEANAWEIKHCRFLIQDGAITITKLPNYGICAPLANRSIACILGPMAVLMQRPQTTQRQLRYVELAFRHYLIARQLCDDLRDWTDDLEAGHASFVVTAILRDLQLPQDTYAVTHLVVTMQKQFRATTLLSVCALIRQHVAKARQCFEKSNLFSDNTPHSTLDAIELSVRCTIDQHEKSVALLKTQLRNSGSNMVLYTKVDD
jgi:hypothetical protein